MRGSAVTAPADLFVAASSPRSRRPLDVASIVGGLVLLVLAARAATADVGPLERSVLAFSTALPGWTASLCEAAYVVCVGFGLVVVLRLALSARTRTVQLLSVAAAAASALVGAALASLIVDGRWPRLTPHLSDAPLDGDFPVVGVAVLLAVLLVLRPWLVRPLRRFDVVLAGVLCVVAWLVGLGDPVAVLGAIGLGTAAAGAVLVAIGSPAGHPELSEVAASLADLGLEVQSLRFATRQPWGVRVLDGVERPGGPLVVKVYGRDAIDAHRAARWWRAIAYRESTMPGATRLQMVEHEALVTLLAERAGVTVVPVVAAAATGGEAIIVLGAPPAPLSEVAESMLDERTLREAWRAVARLHRARLAHGDLGLHTIGRSEERIVLSGFTHGAVAASPAQLAQDTTALLTSQALRVGPARAVAAALDGSDRTAVVAAQPYLQRAALPRHLRTRRDLKTVLGGLSAEICERTGTAPAPPAPLVRVRWQDILRSTFLVVAAYGLFTVLAPLDWALVIESWADASWSWLAVGLLAAQLTTVADAVSTMSAVTTRLPLLPLVHLQYAVKFVGLAISSTASRVALNTAMLHRFGEGPSVAVTATALDTVAGAIANVGVVLVALYLGNGEGVSSLELGGLAGTVVLVAGLLVAACLAVVLVRPLRRRAVRALRSTWTAFRVVLASPERALVLLGSNLASLLITAVSLACMVRAIHPPLSFGTVVAVTAAAGLISSIVPVPGNIGVAEAAITAGLVLVGVPDSPAFAIAVSQRIATTYLPSVVGAFSLRWLRREDFV